MRTKNTLGQYENSVDIRQSEDSHRADSMTKPQIELSKTNGEPKKKTQNVFSYISAIINLIFSEVKQMKLELVMFLYTFGSTMRLVSFTTMIMDKVCLVHQGYTEDVCMNLSQNITIKMEVEKVANNYNVGLSIIHMLPASILACFIGAWSDKYSRKIPLMVALIGIIIDGLGSTLCAVFLHSRVEFIYIAALFTGFSGGFISILTVLYSYATDITAFKKRTVKYALLGGAFSLSMPLGQLAGGWIYHWAGYVPVFLASTGCHIYNLVWILFVLEETRGLDNKESWRVKFSNLWSFRPVIESFKATVKVRPNKGKDQILLLMLAMSIAIFSYTSLGSIIFLYCHHMFNWGNTKFSTISSIFSVTGTVAMLISVPIFKRFRVPDPILGIIGSISLVTKDILLGASSKVELYYIGSSLGLLGGLTTLAGRARISKVTSKEDIGKVFAFLSTAETMLPVIGAGLVSQVFNLTMKFYPGAIFIGMGCILLIPLAVFIWLSRLPPMNPEQTQSESLESTVTHQPNENSETKVVNNSSESNAFELKSKV